MPAPASVLLNRLMARAKFRHVQVLLRLAELGSVQRAADAIGLTQSSVTQTLAYLEALLEVKLFQRHARGVLPTAACKDLLPVARQMMIGLADAADMVRAHQVQQGGIVRLLASAAATHSLLLPTLQAFHQAHPEIQIHLREAEGEDQLLAVARGEVDLVACRRPVAVPAGWQFQPLLADQFIIVCAPGHGVLKARRHGLAALARETWLQAPAETLARLRFDELAQAFGAPPRMHPLVTRQFALALDLLLNQGVLALLPQSFVQHALKDGRLAQLADTPRAMPLDPMGLLTPMPGTRAGPGAGLLAAHLARHFAAP